MKCYKMLQWKLQKQIQHLVFCMEVKVQQLFMYIGPLFCAPCDFDI